MTNLILCGGAGTRLWPWSRTSLPKQFVKLFGGRTLFEETVLRNQTLCDSFWVASNSAQMELAREQLSNCGVAHFGELVEPVGRNTAPAIALVCLALPPEEIVFVTPSDHRISKTEAYKAAVLRARELAEQGSLVTFGIRPSYAETGFGYVEAEGETIRSFREKPDTQTAQSYVDTGRYLWNSGMFVFRAGVFLEELRSHSPQIYEACVNAGSRPSRDAMLAIPSESIDYAVMEKSNRGKVVPCDPGWSDLGSFDALYDESSPTDQGNTSINSMDPIAVDSFRNLVIGSSRTVALVGIQDLIVVDTPDALLLVRRGQSQNVKTVVNQLKEQGSRLLD